jgi:hypothetical protein
MRKLAGSIAVISFAAKAYANDITISDTVGSGSGWYGAQENNEVEPNCVTSQIWDMEKFLFNPTTKKLQMQGGFDMVNGVNAGSPYGYFYSGDIFIDVNGDARWGANTPTGLNPSGNGYQTVGNANYKWDYVIAFGRTGGGAGGGVLDGTYRVYNITGSSVDVLAYFDQNDKSNPMRYSSGGSLVTSGGGLTQTSFLDGEGTHYVLGNMDLSFLAGTGTGNFTFHFTEGCGNDLLMGRTTAFSIPDGGLTAGLLGLSLSVIGLCGRRRVRKTS